MAFIEPVIDAALSQTVRVDHVEINIPLKLIRNNQEYEIPGWMHSKRGLRVFRTEDFGAITKVAPTFIRYEGDKDTFIWSIDDDCVFPHNQLELLMAAHDKHERRILARYGGELKDDGTTQNWFGSTRVSFFEGYGGVLYPPQCVLPNDFGRYLDITSQNVDCRESDDIVLSMYFNRIGMPIHLHNEPSKETPYMVSGFLPQAAVDSLSKEGHEDKYRRVYHFIKSLHLPVEMKLELGCGTTPTPGFVHHDRRRHSLFVDVEHDLDQVPWPWANDSCEEIIAMDVFEHLHLMPEAWLRECHRILAPGGTLRLRVPIFGSPWHIVDPTHVRGFHPLNFEYFIRGRDLWHRYGHYYFDFAFEEGSASVEGYNVVAELKK
jgi:hypothetical protein